MKLAFLPAVSGLPTFNRVSAHAGVTVADIPDVSTVGGVSVIVSCPVYIRLSD
jgi:hypothetical protein